MDFYCHKAKLVVELDGSQHYEEENVLKNIALFANDLEYKKSFLNEFQKFEFENNNKECIEPFIRDRDLFLRFTSTTKSKAVKFNFPNYN